MKKVLLSVVMIMVAFAAGAQNKAIDKMAAKYADKEGFTVMNMEGEMIKSLGGAIGAKIGDVDVSKTLEGLSSVTVIISQKAHEEFAEDMKSAVAAINYSPLVSHSEEGTLVKILSIDLKGKDKNNKEMVITVITDDTHVLVRIIGNIDPETMKSLIETIK